MGQDVTVDEFARVYVKSAADLPASGDNRYDDETGRYYFKLDFDRLQKADTPVSDVLTKLKERFDVEVTHRVQTGRVVKERRYVDSPDDVPDGYKLEEGPKGGVYYETNPTNISVGTENASAGVGYDDQPVYAILADYIVPGDVVAFERGDGSRDTGEVVEASDGYVKVETGDGELNVQPAPFKAEEVAETTLKAEGGGGGGDGSSGDATLTTDTEGVHNTRYSPDTDDEKEEDLGVAGEIGKADDSGPWVSYVGPEGGEGWLNLQTCEVRYQAERPGDGMEGYDEEPWHDGWSEYDGDLSALSVGDQVQYEANGETNVATVQNQNIDETGKVHLDDGYYFDADAPQFTDITGVSEGSGEVEQDFPVMFDESEGWEAVDDIDLLEPGDEILYTKGEDDTVYEGEVYQGDGGWVMVDGEDGSSFTVEDPLYDVHAFREGTDDVDDDADDWQQPVDYDPAEGWDYMTTDTMSGEPAFKWSSHGAEVALLPDEYDGDAEPFYNLVAGMEGDTQYISANYTMDELESAFAGAAWILDHMNPAQVKQIGYNIEDKEVFNEVYNATETPGSAYDGDWIKDTIDDKYSPFTDGETEPEPEPEPETTAEDTAVQPTEDAADPTVETVEPTGDWTEWTGDYDVTAFDEDDFDEWGPLSQFNFPSGVSANAMDIGALPEYDGSDNRGLVFRRKFGDGPNELDPETGHRQMVSYTIGSVLGGNMPTHAGHAEEDGYTVSNGVEGHDIGAAPDEVLQKVDEDHFIEQAAIQVILGNNDAHSQNVKVTPDGQVVFHDIDHTAGDISSDFVGKKGSYKNAIDRTLGELYNSGQYVVEGDSAEVKQKILSAAEDIAQQHAGNGAGETDEGYSTFSECVMEEGDKDDPEAFCASIFFGNEGDNELAQALKLAVGYSPELAANVQNNIQNLANGDIQWQ